VSTVELKGVPKVGEGAGASDAQRSIVNRRRARVVEVGPVAPTAKLMLTVDVPQPYHLTAERPSEWQLVGVDGGPAVGGSTRGPIAEKVENLVELRAAGPGVVELESAVYFCQTDKGVCRSDGVVFRITTKEGAPTEASVEHQVQLKQQAPKVGAM
jgi:hypothetical protein